MATKKKQAGADAAQLRRMYIDCRYGQMHLISAYPSSGGFNEASPLLLLHTENGSGADFNRYVALLGMDRSVYAPDLPGSGASDAPQGSATINGLAAAVGDLIDQLRLRQVDLFACGRSVQIAFELAATRPQDVRRLIVASQQQATAATSKPLLQLGGDPDQILQQPATEIVAAIRDFLDGAG